VKRWRGPLVAALFFACFAAAILWMVRDDQAVPRSESGIAVIACGSNSERWRMLDQGVRQACVDLGIEKPVISTAKRTGSPLLSDLLQRQIEGGAKGLLIAAGEQRYQDRVAAAADRVPVVLLESGIGDTLTCIVADNAGMGRALAEYAAGEPGHVAVLASGLARRSVAERRDAFVQRMEELGKPVTVIECDNIQVDAKSFLASTLATHEPAINLLAALDNDALEMAVDAVPAAMVDIALCGVGSSDKAVYALDLGIVRALVFQNEYAIGYLGTMALAAEMGLAKAPGSAEIQYRLVTKETMYDPELEQLLFPIMQ